MWQGRGGSERGSVAITVVLAMTVLLGLAALVVDIGLNWAARTSAQTAADSAALAGASTLITDGGAAAILSVVDHLDTNVDGLADPANLVWVDNIDESDGEIVCWTLPNPPPGPGAGCPDGSNALQVITPPIEVNYAFAPLLGQGGSSIKATAAAAAGPAAPNNCALCVLEPDGLNAMNVLGSGGVEVDGGGIVVNSEHPTSALVASTLAGDISADQIRVVGGLSVPGGVQLLPPAELNGPPVPDPLADLPDPAGLTIPPPPLPNPVQDITADTTLGPGVYEGINVESGTLTLEEGVYVITEFPGFRVRDGGRVVGDGVTIYLTCEDYPTQCDGEDGARFRLDPTSRFLATPPATGEYAGLSVFADRGNTISMQLLGDVTLAGAVYGASTQLRVGALADVQIDALVVVDRLRAASADPVRVNYNPSLPLIGIEPPVLIR
jgi:Putative Flp pilus-assembly TadE/G-like